MICLCDLCAGDVGRRAVRVALNHRGDEGLDPSTLTVTSAGVRSSPSCANARMTYVPGLPKDADIDNVIAYLKQFGADGKRS